MHEHLFENFNVETLPRLPLSKKNVLPNYAAIYFVLSSTDEILYIGSADKLRTRWYQHHRFNELLTLKDVKIAWLEFRPYYVYGISGLSLGDAYKALLAAEQRMIDMFDPFMNKPSKRTIKFSRAELEGLACVRDTTGQMEEEIVREAVRYFLRLKGLQANDGVPMLSPLPMPSST